MFNGEHRLSFKNGVKFFFLCVSFVVVLISCGAWNLGLTLYKLTRGRLMTAAECADYAAAEGRPFIGRGTEAKEYPGCVRWESGHVEFNEHSDEGEGCNLGRKGRCVCAVKA